MNSLAHQALANARSSVTEAPHETTIKKTPSREADKFVVRLPDGLRTQVEEAADAVCTSMNTIFIQAVRQYLDGQKRQELLLDVLAAAAAKVTP